MLVNKWVNSLFCRLDLYILMGIRLQLGLEPSKILAHWSHDNVIISSGTDGLLMAYKLHPCDAVHKAGRLLNPTRTVPFALTLGFKSPEQAYPPDIIGEEQLADFGS